MFYKNLPISKERYKELEKAVSESFKDRKEEYNKQVKRLKKKLEKLTLGQFSILMAAITEIIDFKKK